MALLVDLQQTVYPSAAGLVQTSESSPVRDQRSTTEPPNQLGGDIAKSLADAVGHIICQAGLITWALHSKQKSI